MKAVVQAVYDNPDGQYGANVCVVVALENGEEFRYYENKYDSEEATYFKKLKRGDVMYFHEEEVWNPKKKEKQKKLKPDWVTMATSSNGPAEAANESVQDKRAALDAEIAKVMFFQKEGIRLARELADEFNLSVSDDAILERGGNIGTSLLMGMSRRGY